MAASDFGPLKIGGMSLSATGQYTLLCQGRDGYYYPLMSIADSGAFTSSAGIINSSGVLNTSTSLTGSNLYGYLIGLSGITLNSSSLIQSGLILYQLVTGLSGQSINTYSTINNLYLTGTNLSAIQITGSNIINIVNFTGVGGTNIYISGNYIVISGSQAGGGSSYDPLGTAANTGQIVYNDLIGLSGQANLNYATITNLTITGVTIESQIASLSGYAGNASGVLQTELNNTNINLYSSGSNLYINLTGASGQFNTNFATQTNVTLTGQLLYNDIGILYNDITGLSGQFINESGQLQTNINTVSTNLITTGSIIYIDLIGMSGQQNTNFATIVNLINTGITIEGQINSLSGYIGNSSGSLQTLLNSVNINLTSSGQNLSAIKVTGSSILNNANITGIGTTIVLYSGGYICISGTSANAGGSYDPLGTAANTGQSLYLIVSGFSGQFINSSGTTSLLNNEIAFSNGSNFIGNPNFIYSLTGGYLNLGNSIIYPYTIIAISSGTTGYTQVTLQNVKTFSGASADFVATADSGTDSTYYIDLGINNSIYNQPTTNVGTGYDGYLVVQGDTGALNPGQGNLFIGTQSSGTKVNIFAGNVTGNPSVIIDSSGLNIPIGFTYRIGDQIIQNLFDATGTAANSGSLLYINITGLSGAHNTLITNTGATLYNDIVNMSGQANTNYATISSLNLVSGLSISGTLERKPQFSITFIAGNTTWTNMQAATNFFNLQTGSITYQDLTYYTGVQLVFPMLATAGAATGSLFLGYLGNYSTTASNYLSIDSNTTRSKINLANSFVNSGFQPLVAGAKSGVFLALLGSGGSAAVSPIFGMVVANFK